MQILGTLERAIRLVVALAMLGWIGYGAYLSFSVRQAELDVAEQIEANQEQTFASDPAPIEAYGQHDPYSAPMDDTIPADDWGE